jgi:hypothetical protein
MIQIRKKGEKKGNTASWLIKIKQGKLHTNTRLIPESWSRDAQMALNKLGRESS